MRADDATNPFVGLSFLLLAIGYSFLQGTVMAVQLPEIAASVGISNETGALAATIMIAVSGATLITAGQTADRVGRRRMCLAGLLVVIVASGLTAASQNGTQLLLARALQGLGTAMLLTSIGLISVLFERSERRDVAFGLLGASVGVGLALAPIVAAGALALGSWRWSFWLNLPVFGVAFLGIRRTVPESRDDTGTAGSDWLGTISLAIGLVCGLFALTQGGRYGWWRPTEVAFGDWSWPLAVSPIAMLLLVALVSLAAFVRIEGTRVKRSLPVLMDRHLLRVRRFALGCVVSFLFVLGGYAVQFMVPVFGRVVLDDDTLQVALLTAVSGAGIAVGGVLAAPIGDRLGGRFVVLIGVGVAASTLALVTYLLSYALGGAGFGAVLFGFGVGYGLAYARITEVALVDVPSAQTGLASGMLVASRTCAMALGAAALTVLISTNSDMMPPTTDAELQASRLAFTFGAAILIGALVVAMAIPKEAGASKAAAVVSAPDTKQRREQ